LEDTQLNETDEMHLRMYIDWIRAGLERPGKTQYGLADAMGVTPSIIVRLLSGRRRLRIEELPTISKYLGLPEPSGDSAFRGLKALPAWRDIGDGIWFSNGGKPFKQSSIQVPLVFDARHAHLKQLAVRHKGEAFPKSVPNGAYLIYVPYFEARTKIADGDLVVAQRTRADGISLIIRRICVENGKMALKAEGSRKAFPTLKLSNFDIGEKVTVEGLICWIVSKVW
jgi:transcriptional regulator with XRE-family HTH domain